jgi:hypothetical protein
MTQKKSKVLLQSVAMLSACSLLAACTFGPGPIERSVTQDMAICNATHDARACDQWTYSAPLVQGERERQVLDNTEKTQGLGVALRGLAELASAFPH